MKPMLLTEATDIPIGDDWLYETKYDGFRCILEWEHTTPILKSRNDNVLNQMFPEIISFCENIFHDIQPLLPLVVDGEIVYLQNNFASEFSIVQQRGRMRSDVSIAKHAKKFPCHFLIFDLLTYKGTTQINKQLTTRKQLLLEVLTAVKLPMAVDYKKDSRLQGIKPYDNGQLLWQNIQLYNGEGVVAKKKTSAWLRNSRSTNWLKIKNFRYVTVIVFQYDKVNSYFRGGVFRDEQLVEVVTFKHGMKVEQFQTLVAFFQSQGTKNGETWELAPAICVDIACIGFDGTKLREPRFHSFHFEKNVEHCRWEQMQRQLFPIPTTVHITHPEKLVYPHLQITKDEYLYFLQNIGPHLLTFLQDRILTIIRYPNGVFGERFYQKNSPEKVPDFVETKTIGEDRHILCNNLETLLWLGNLLALEYHVPFQPIYTEMPTEIVFDLDPPSVKEFPIAIKTALKMKAILDQFQLDSFVKTSGGKGMQIYVPLPMNTFSYKDTGIFTQFVCEFLVKQFPQWLTVERLKKNRGSKLYLDYVQHREGKTIVAPYSPRGNEQGLVATPLYWDEVNEKLKPELFTIRSVLGRIKTQGNPFQHFRKDLDRNGQHFQAVLNQLKTEGTSYN